MQCSADTLVGVATVLVLIGDGAFAASLKRISRSTVVADKKFDTLAFVADCTWKTRLTNMWINLN